MPSPIRPKNTPVIAKLVGEPSKFKFFQAVRLIERAAIFRSALGDSKLTSLQAKNPPGKFVPPSSEILKFNHQVNFAFQETEIKKVSSKTAADPNSQWNMSTSFIGLNGSSGVLPYHYTELLLQRLKQKDESLLHFVNIFNHRTISLFYQAGIKYNPALDYERKKLYSQNQLQKDTTTSALLALVGLGTKGLNNRSNLKDETLIYYGGLFSQSVRNTTSLKQILEDYFSIPVKIEEFIGEWQELLPDLRTRLASKKLPKGQNCRLGKSAMLGGKGWFAQGKIRIVLGPLNRQQFDRFAPGTTGLKALNELVRLYLGMEHAYEFVIDVKRSDIPNKVQLTSKTKPIMGWNTWLSTSAAQEQDKDKTLRIRVSASRLN